MDIMLKHLHDGYHIPNCDCFFEWWYFDFDIDKNKHLYLEWHAPAFNNRDNYCMLVVRYYDTAEVKKIKDNSQILLSYRYPKSQVIMDNTKCSIRFPAGIIEEVDTNYIVQIKEKDFEINAVLERKLFPVSFEDGLLVENKDNQEFFFWYVPLPKAAVSGSIHVNGRFVILAGVSYHDHNWGNIVFKKNINRWVWIRVHFDRYTIICSVIHLKNHQNRTIFITIDNKTGLATFEDATFLYSISERFIKPNIGIPDTLILTAGGGAINKIVINLGDELYLQEAPLCNIHKNPFNSFYSKLYHIAQLHILPDLLKEKLGRMIYYQAQAKCELYNHSEFIDSKTGKLECIVFNEE